MGPGRPRFSALDLAILALVLLAGLAAYYRIRDGLNYRWDWGAMPQYLLRYDPAAGRWRANVLLQGFFMTIGLSIWTMLFASLIGAGVGFLRLSRHRFRRWAGTVYVELTRNTPPLVLVFIFYFFIGDQLLPALELERLFPAGAGGGGWLPEWLAPAPGALVPFISAVLTLSIVEGAYIAEIVRAGIRSIERGQGEAAAALGFSRRQRMRHIILPQAWQQILPPLGGQFISTIKDSAIVSVISIQELTFRGMELMSSTYLSFETWITITGLYFALTFGCSLAVARLEACVRRRRSRRPPP
jgi:polar amino acid transport system permease protein